MFGTILGGLPMPPPPRDGQPAGESPLDVAVRLVIAAQEAAGLEPVTDGQLRWPGLLPMAVALEGVTRRADGTLRVSGSVRRREPLAVEAWRFAAGCTDRLVKQQLPGPYTLTERLAPDAEDPDAVALAFADALRAEIAALADAGCRMVEVEEPDAVGIGTDAARRSRFAAAHRRLTEGVGEVHLSLAIGGGNADAAGVETIMAGAWASLAVDLIAGPDNWRLVVGVPGTRGIVCGVIEAREGSGDGPELPLWASRYAASTKGRGLVRVGLANAAGLDRLRWDVAAAKISALGRAAHVAGLPPGDELARSVDPRSIDIRAAAFGSAAARQVEQDRRARRRR